MNSMPKFSHLAIFKEIVCCGSLHETSKKLALSQPTLSRIIKELEENIGSRLLERSNRGIKLTAIGDIFHQRIDAITNELRNAIYDVRGLKENCEKFLRVGMSTYPLLCYFGEALEAFNHRYPHTRVTAIEDSPEALVSKLRNYELDLAVCSLSEGISCADLVTQQFKCEKFSLYHGCRQGDEEQSITESKWVIPRSCSAGFTEMRDVVSQNAPQGSIVETDSFLATWILVKQQGYLALLSDKVVTQYASHLNLEPIPEERLAISANFYIITRNEPAKPDIVSEFINILQAV